MYRASSSDLMLRMKKYPAAWSCGIAVGIALGIAWMAAAERETPRPSLASRLRRPVAAVPLADGNRLCVANRAAGSLSLVDLRQARVLDELELGQQLSGLAILPDRRHVLAVDEQRHELIGLVFDGSR